LGNAASNVSAAPVSASRWSIVRVPCTEVPITAPIDDNTVAMIASATSASINVNPLVPSERFLRDNIDASGKPVDADLIPNARSRQSDRTTARHPGRKEID
jgi:hypothetical protein